MNYNPDPERERLADQYISGFGIEIGALCHPLKVDGVTYIDRFDQKGLNKQYPEIPTDIMCRVDAVDDGEILEGIDSSSQDFVIANHFLEHCKNPIQTIGNWLRVLKSGGIIFCAIPNKDECFDKDRETTTWEHILEEYRTGFTNDEQHYKENAVEMDTNYSIHYHCWDHNAIHQFWDRVCDILPCKIEESVYNPLRQEYIFIGRKK
jgi:predicted SAM-dependent methyltransferase